MRKFSHLAAIGAGALALAGPATVAAAGNADRASCEGVVASLAGAYAPGTVAYLTHLLQGDAAAAGVSMGSLNLVYAQSKGDCF